MHCFRRLRVLLFLVLPSWPKWGFVEGQLWLGLIWALRIVLFVCSLRKRAVSSIAMIIALETTFLFVVSFLYHLEMPIGSW